MGSPEDEPGRATNEPRHRVVVTRPQWLQVTEVTQAQWEARTGTNPSWFSEEGGGGCVGDPCATRPVEMVSWWEALEYANRLSDAASLERCYRLDGCNGEAPGDGLHCEGVTELSSPIQACAGYRLPTEAEWEWAARAGTETAFYNGEMVEGVDDCIAEPALDLSGWYCANAESRTHPVADTESLPEVCNARGLCDMHGNLWEWTWDRGLEDYGGYGAPNVVEAGDVDPVAGVPSVNPVIRGGNWGNYARYCSAAVRQWDAPESRRGAYGFRLTRSNLFPAGCGPETCNGRDDDCDGQTDEGEGDDPLTGTCYSGPPGTRGVGLCAAGTRTCDQGQWTACDGEAVPAAEECDGADNDCDGVTDEEIAPRVGPDGGEWVCVPPTGPDGYWMGSPEDEPGRDDPEERHRVALTRAQWMKATEVTQAEWQALVGGNPSWFSAEGGGGCAGDPCEDRPVDQVSWFEALEYANRLSDAAGLDRCYRLARCNGVALGDGLECLEAEPTFDPQHACPGFRLPTEAEWEWAARAGTETAFHNGDSTIDHRDCAEEPALETSGWYCHNSGSRTHLVADTDSLPEVCNAWGLCDMSGNASEWAWDGYSQDYGGFGDPGVVEEGDVDPVGVEGSCRLMRGGAYSTIPFWCGSATRYCAGWGSALAGYGFRLTRSNPFPPGCGPETCNGEDDDCDGATDEGADGEALTRRCWGGEEGTEYVGACRAGTETCIGGDWTGECEDEVRPAAEACNGLDDDCDGETDEGLVHHGPDGTDWACVPPTSPLGYWMGSPEDEPGRQWHGGVNETRHRVRLTRPFWTKTTEVTQDQWEARGLTNPSYWQEGIGGCRWFPCTSRPVESVTWYEALEYTNRLSDAAGLARCYDLQDCDGDAPGEGLECATVLPRFDPPQSCPGYRLPTEAEWEWAARAGTETAFHNGPSTHDGTGCAVEPVLERSGWYCNITQETHPVADLASLPEVCNAWGLCDMHGNAWEWTWDGYSHGYGGYGAPAVVEAGDVDPLGSPGAQTRTNRGGSYSYTPAYCRAADRVGFRPGTIDRFHGLRPVRTIVHEAGCGPETCNGRDDDCDGQTDEADDGGDLTGTCYSGPPGTRAVGACRAGTRTCDQGEWTACDGEVVPAEEDCDGVDQDCDGTTDESDAPPGCRCAVDVNGTGLDLELCTIVPAGGSATFRMGCREDLNGPGWSCQADEHVDADTPQLEVGFQHGFEVMRTEVTEEQYRACVLAGHQGCVAADVCDSGSPNYGEAGSERRPIVCVSWEMARAFASWIGGRLPSEAEWEYAARGPMATADDYAVFPWGDAPADCSRAAFGDCPGEEVDVGSFSPAGDSPFGLADLAGNVWEWTADCYHGSYEGAPAGGVAREGCGAGDDRTVRGGDWDGVARQLRAASRGAHGSGDRRVTLGFRVARTLQP